MMPELNPQSLTVNHRECHGNVFKWWKKVKHPTVIGRFFPSFQTRLLDKSLNEFSSLLETQECRLKQKRLSALKLLQTQILDWQHMHVINKRTSHRHQVIDALLQWVNKEIQTSGQPSVNEVKAEPNRQQASLSLPSSDETLYNWWKKHNRQHGFTWRSDATKELDKAIRWYSNAIIVYKQEALQEILNAIDVWLYARKDQSNRQPLVLQLKHRVEAEIARIGIDAFDEQSEDDDLSFGFNG
ncbi:hypothetical protein [Legionella erythra]|nr:hypothetical protein [Legionella erythra]